MDSSPPCGPPLIYQVFAQHRRSCARGLAGKALAYRANCAECSRISADRHSSSNCPAVGSDGSRSNSATKVCRPCQLLLTPTAAPTSAAAGQLACVIWATALDTQTLSHNETAEKKGVALTCQQIIVYLRLVRFGLLVRKGMTERNLSSRLQMGLGETKRND